MKLKRLLKDLPEVEVKGSKEIEITGISANSKFIAPGNLFIAKQGLTQHGVRFIPDAIEAGATCILSDIYNPFLPEEIVQLVHPDVSALESLLVKTFYENPTEKLFLVGITGTNGKTTTAYLVRHLFEGCNLPCGQIGTVEWIVGENRLPPLYTTPDLFTTYKLLHDMVQHGCKAATMEVSSQALDQERVREIIFDVAVFTNLTQDHLDYHQTMEKYAEAKAKLFRSLCKQALLNADSPWSEVLRKDCPVPVMTYGLQPGADLRATKIALTPQGMHFSATYKGETCAFFSPLIGRFNLYNILAALGVALLRGFALADMPALIKTFTTARGRLERVDNPRGLNIFVDYAHTDDALHNVLTTLREIKKGRLITVFGCGGDRDKGKRPKMGKVAEKFSDITIVTSDNPRSEDPEAIISSILTGFSDPTKPITIPDRRDAIKKALELATPDDMVLIAGKGHETTQIFSHQTIHFDDRAVAKEIIEGC